MAQNLSRLEWYKRASTNLRKYLAELEAALAALPLGDERPTEYLISQVKRRLAALDQQIAEAEHQADRDRIDRR